MVLAVVVLRQKAEFPGFVKPFRVYFLHPPDHLDHRGPFFHTKFTEFISTHY